MLRYFSFFILMIIIGSSCQRNKTIVDKKDYEAFLIDGKIDHNVKNINNEINFWQERLSKDTGSYVNMLELASNHLQLFRLNGNIAALNTGDSLLKASSSKLRNTNPEILYSLSQNSISQHQFINAEQYTNAALKAQGDLFTVRLLQFDVSMELGKYQEAYASLQSLKEKSSFDYLIRKAKWEDHRGNLDGAIEMMEQAFELVKDKKKSLYCWTLSNLGDMYGHAGRIKEAYDSYIKVLNKDSANLYCLKGIAWIAYAHDNNTSEAKRIIQFILSQTSIPDLKLTLAQIAETEGDESAKQKFLNEFVTTVTKPGYGDMYNKYLIEIYNEELIDHSKAFSIAERELNNRFTPETCDWMAWTYYNKGEIQKAYEYSKAYVNKMTFEPGATMHTAFIYADNGKKAEAKQMLEECLLSSFELGPVATRQIEKKLQSL